MTQYNDLEALIDEIITFLKADLNNCITQVNSEHSDFDIDPVLDSEYFLFFRGRPNTAKMLIVELDQPEAKSNKGLIATKAIVLTTIIIPDEIKGDEDYRRSLRYLEALKRTFEKNAFNFMQTMEFEMMAPFWFDKNQVYKFSIGAGIQISTDL